MSSDPVDRWYADLRDQPRHVRVGLVAVAIIAVSYAVLIGQELLLVIWLAALLFFAYLAWRFVRAFERIAAAADRFAAGRSTEDD